MDPMPNLGRIYQLAIQEESQQRTATSGRGSEAMALAARGHYRPPQRNLRFGGGKGAISSGGRNPSSFLNEQMDGSDLGGRSDGPSLSSNGLFSDGPQDIFAGAYGPHEIDGPRGKFQAREHGPRGIQPTGPEALYGPTSAQIFQPNNRFFSKSNSQKGRGKLYCDYCKRPHHTIENCWKLHGKPGEKERGKSSQVFQALSQPTEKSVTHEQYQELMRALKGLDASDKAGSFTGTSYCLMNSISKNAWIIDSGASDHIVCDKGFFTKIQKLSFPISVQLPNGNSTQVVMTGTVNLSPLITLRNVLYVPEFQFNLISVNQASKENSCRVLFTPDNCFFQALSTGKLMGLGKAYQGLYFWMDFPSNFNLSSVEFNNSLCNYVINDKNFLHHKRLGHSALFPCPQCPICPLAKQTRAPFPKSNSRIDSIFSLIHADVWGPYHTENHDGS